MRLNRFLAHCGLGSRRSCEQLIRAGRIVVNGVGVTDLATRVDPAVDTVEYKGKTLRAVRPPEYLAYHKSKGPVVTHRDPRGRRTVFEAIEEGTGRSAAHLNYIGRLDRNSEGLLLLTNDGAMIHGLTHPRFHIKKIYRVRTERPLDNEALRRMTHEGVESRGQVLHAKAVKPVPSPHGGRRGEHWYEVHLLEGKNRQIRRMFESLSHRIVRLKRVRFGPINLGNQKRGSIRELTEEEIEALRRVGYRQGEGAKERRGWGTTGR